MNSKLPQINWRGETTDWGFRLGIAGELMVGKRRLRHAAVFNRSESIQQAADMVEAKLWALNYDAALDDARQRAHSCNQ